MARRPRSSLSDLALVAVFAALIAAFTLTPAIPVGALGVPITLQTLGVALAGLVLGPWRGFLAVLLYLVMGLAGLPVFAAGGAGVGVLVRPSAGYLVSFPLAALLIGALAQLVLARWTRRGARGVLLFAAAVAGSIAVVYPLGIAGLHLNAGLAWPAAFAANLPFVPGDLLKSLVAALIAVAVHRAFPDLLARRRVAAREPEPAGR